jgi:hypothetical protein
MDNLQVVTTNNYNTVADFHILQIIAANAKSLPACSVFTGCFLVTAFNNDCYSASFLTSCRVLTAKYQLSGLPQFSSLWLLGRDRVESTAYSRMSNFIPYRGNVFSEPLLRNGSDITAHLTIVAQQRYYPLQYFFIHSLHTCCGTN